MIRSNKGNALIGAMTAVAVSGMIGTAMIAYYEAFVRQSRQAYVRAIMTALDNKIRFMANTPYAYICADQKAGATVANALDGIHSCEINVTYFRDLMQVIVPGAACPANAPCGFKLEFKTPVPPATNPPLNFGSAVDPDTGAANDVGLFPYRLSYEGTDFSLRPGGYDIALAGVGMPVPREVLQSQAFDCSATDATKPIFGGFSTDGKPICRGFNECAAGQYGTSITFRQLKNGTPDLLLTCRDLRTPDKAANCNTGQNKVSGIGFASGVMSYACSELPVPPLNAVVVTPPAGTAGVCGSSNGMSLTAAPTSGLCATGTPTAVAGTGPWTWSCSGSNGGPSASCQALNGPCTSPISGGGKFYLTAGAVFQVPCDWGNNNTIEVIGGGGGGWIGEGGAGGGGGYSKVSNVNLEKGASLVMSVGVGGKGAQRVAGKDVDGSVGGDTFVGGGNCATSVVCAKGGLTFPTNKGGQASDGVGQVKYSGGDGDMNSNSGSGGGGGAGPNGNGGNGGTGLGYAGGAGGGNGGGQRGGNGATNVGGVGGAGFGGGAGGSGGSPTSPPSDGTGGGGGGGGGGNSTGGGGKDARRRGGNGSSGTEWDASHGSGGGGGGNGNNGGDAGRGALYGGGGGGTEDEGNAGDGGPGIVVITYTP